MCHSIGCSQEPRVSASVFAAVSSIRRISSSVSFIREAAAASATWRGLVAPTRGSTPFAIAHAIATCATEALCSSPTARITFTSFSICGSCPLYVSPRFLPAKDVPCHTFLTMRPAPAPYMQRTSFRFPCNNPKSLPSRTSGKANYNGFARQKHGNLQPKVFPRHASILQDCGWKRQHF